MNEKKNKKEASLDLSIKDAYEEAGRNYRYFLSWRERLLAGYFALLAGLFFAFSWLIKEAPKLTWTPFAVGFILTLVMWALEYRNRDLYRVCQQTAKECESGLPKGMGMFTEMLSKVPRIYHSTLMLVGVVWSLWYIDLVYLDEHLTIH
ncbi:MAG: hypothetical protein V2I56_11050 [Desulfobacteraceae bacterium]|nr:hypothetical protein [Desulfobacteraceae bacterium]